MFSLPIFLIFGATLSISPMVYASPTLVPRANCSAYTISGISGGFATWAHTDFTNASAGSSASTFLSNNGFAISSYSLPGSPKAHTWSSNNVALSTVDGFTALDLKVSAYTSGNVICAEVVTDATFTYASARTVLKSSPTAGIVEGNFFYESDTQEIDIEILTTTALHASAQVPAGIRVSNQATTAGGKPTNETIPFSFDPSADFHEYRTDWIPGATSFYIDGSKIATITTNVPTQAGSWVWNVWSNGASNWTAGPPTTDTHTYIKTIDLYTGYSDSVSGTTCSI